LLYDTQTGKPTQTLKLEGVGCIGAAFSPNGSRLFLVTDRPWGRKRDLELIAFDIKTGQPARRTSRPGRTAKVWVLSNNQSALVLSEVFLDAMTSQRQLWTWNSEQGKVTSEWKSDDYLWSSRASVRTEVLSPDRRFLALMTCRSGPDKTELVRVRVLDTNTLTEYGNFAFPPVSAWALGGLGTGEYPSSLAFSPDNRTLAVGIATGIILLYDIKPFSKLNPK